MSILNEIRREKLDVKIDLGECGASSEIKIYIGGKEITSRIRSFRLTGEGGSLAKLEMEMSYGKTEVLIKELGREQVVFTGFTTTIAELTPYWQHLKDCPARIRSHGEECNCGLEATLNRLSSYEDGCSPR